ncbi:hypothetical protein [Pseudomonas fluorescens]|uniref:hypothetical protein n=1 Tax=Pseudomonas fluorescens TaxID=294 RepID=UPI000937FEBF|nr:hypothetical protein [Pseudomonas fluorescens]
MIKQVRANIEGVLTTRIDEGEVFTAVSHSFSYDVKNFTVAGYFEDGRNIYFSFDKNIEPGTYKFDEVSKISAWYNAGPGYSWIALRDGIGEVVIKKISVHENACVELTFKFKAKQFEGDDSTIITLDGVVALKAVTALATIGEVNVHIKGGPSFSADKLYFLSEGGGFYLGGSSSEYDGLGVFLYFDFLNVEERVYEISERDEVYAWYNPSEAHGSWLATEGAVDVKSFSLTGEAFIKLEYRFTAVDRIGTGEVDISGTAELTGLSRAASR